MNKKLIIIISAVIQFITSWFLLTFIVFADSYANWLELGLYLLLSFLPYGISLAIYFRTLKIKQAVLSGIGLYILSACILSSLDNIKDFYVTGMGGIDFHTSLSVMAIHSAILCITIFFLSRTEEQSKRLLKQLPLVLLCIILTFFLVGIYQVLDLRMDPSSYLPLGYVDIQNTLEAVCQSAIFGFFDIFFNLKVLIALTVYGTLCFTLISLKENISNKNLSFGKKLLLLFVPVWLLMGIYGVRNWPELRENLKYNFVNFQPVWDHHAQIHPYTVQLNNTSFVMWCDKKPITTEKEIICNNHLTVSIAEKPTVIDESVYPKELYVGMFEKIPLYQSTDHLCIYTKNNAIINGTLLLVYTEQCNPREFSDLTGDEWREFIRPLLECFGYADCEISDSRY